MLVFSQTVTHICYSVFVDELNVSSCSMVSKMRGSSEMQVATHII